MGIQIKEMNDILRVYQEDMGKSGFNFLKFWKEMDPTLRSKYRTDNAKFFGLFFDELEKGNKKLIQGLDLVKILDTFPDRWKKERISDSVLMKSIPPKHWEDFRDSTWLKNHVRSCVTKNESASKVTAALLAAGLFTEKGVNVTALKKVLLAGSHRIKAEDWEDDARADFEFQMKEDAKEAIRKEAAKKGWPFLQAISGDSFELKGIPFDHDDFQNNFDMSGNSIAEIGYYNTSDENSPLLYVRIKTSSGDISSIDASEVIKYVEGLKTTASVTTSATKPAIYVGTYAKYNEGSIEGKWLNLEDYASKDAFYEAAKELHKDEEDPELMFQDFEGFPRRYYSESSLPDALWDWLELDADDRELLEVYIDEVNDNDATIDQARDAFMGKYDSEEDWAQELIGDGGISKDQLNSYLTMSNTDVRILAGEEGDAQLERMDDEDILKEADMAGEYEAEEDEGKKESILDQAKGDLQERYYREIAEKLTDDPVGYFTDETGMYTVEELAKQPFMSIDYESYARDARLSGDVSFVRKDGEVWVFSNHP